MNLSTIDWGAIVIFCSASLVQTGVVYGAVRAGMKDHARRLTRLDGGDDPSKGQVAELDERITDLERTQPL